MPLLATHEPLFPIWRSSVKNMSRCAVSGVARKRKLYISTALLLLIQGERRSESSMIDIQVRPSARSSSSHTLHSP